MRFFAALWEFSLLGIVVCPRSSLNGGSRSPIPFTGYAYPSTDGNPDRFRAHIEVDAPLEPPRGRVKFTGVVHSIEDIDSESSIPLVRGSNTTGPQKTLPFYQFLLPPPTKRMVNLRSFAKKMSIAAYSTGVALPGVNLAGGEFGQLGQPLGQGYIYPSGETIRYYASKGMRLIRLPFMIERIQPRPFGEFSPTDIEALDRCVTAAGSARMLLVLDAHNFGRRDGQPIPPADLADFWSRIAWRYQDELHVAFGLMNQPAAYSPADWRPIVEQTVKALRRAESKHLMIVPGGGWSNAHEWVSSGNAQAFEGFSDENFLIDVTQFLDPGASGTNLQEYESGAGMTRLKAFTEWARQQGYAAFLSSFGFAMPAGQTEAKALLGYMQNNSDVWQAYAYWAGGPWWHDYAYSIEPTHQGDKPQMTLLREFFNNSMKPESDLVPAWWNKVPNNPIIPIRSQKSEAPNSGPSWGQKLKRAVETNYRPLGVSFGSRVDYLRGLTDGKGFGSLPRPGWTRPKHVALPGVNLACAEFGHLGQPMGQGYIYPPDEAFEYYALKGMRLVRVPFMWERVQPETFRDLSPLDAAELDRCVRAAKKAKLLIVLDAHNYGLHGDRRITSNELADLWIRIAKRYATETHVALGLMNEPKTFLPAVWRPIVEETVKALRQTGCKHLLMVPGAGYTGAHDWVSGGNAQAFEGFNDNNFLFEVHQYLDSDHSGTHLQEYTKGGGATRLKAFTEWARKRGYGAFLGEFGFAMPAGETEARALLSYMKENADVWLASAYWAGGPWWHDYAYSIEPTPNGAKQQLVLLREFMEGLDKRARM